MHKGVLSASVAADRDIALCREYARCGLEKFTAAKARKGARKLMNRKEYIF
jgi:hypothetical protein